MGWHKAQHRTNGLRRQKVLEMAEICARLAVSGNGANVLANRWFQPLTHVSEARSPRKGWRFGQEAMREKRETSGYAWHSPRHNTFARRSAESNRARPLRQQRLALTTTQRSCAHG